MNEEKYGEFVEAVGQYIPYKVASESKIALHAGKYYNDGLSARETAVQLRLFFRRQRAGA